MKREPDCIFCRIVAVQVPANVVYENQAVVAFLDIGPLAEGHLLVIPRDHCSRFSDMPPESCSQVAAVLPLLGRALLSVTAAQGFNVLCNEGEAAGQVVKHVHFHLIPRQTGDQLGYRWNAGQYPPGREAQIAAAYQQAITEQAHR